VWVVSLTLIVFVTGAVLCAGIFGLPPHSLHKAAIWTISHAGPAGCCVTGAGKG